MALFALATLIATPASAQNATGAPVIQGTAQVGETLTYSISSIMDPEGWSGTEDGSDWYRVDSDGTSNSVNVATDHSLYTLVAADEGKKIKVTVNFEDYDGNMESLTSAAFPETGTVRAANTAPEITTTSPQSVEENTTAVATLAATDADSGDTHTWSLNGGDDAGKFSLTTAGVLTFTTAPNFENPTDTGTDNGYEVIVRVNDGTVNVDLALTVNVTNDEDEKPDKPAAPTVAATSGSTTSLDVDWDKPGLNGGPDITGYNVQYRVGMSGNWIVHSFSGTDTETKITGLTASTEYQARVQAINGETDSDWSEPGTGSTGSPTNTPATGAPTITGTAHVGRTLVSCIRNAFAVSLE